MWKLCFIALFLTLALAIAAPTAGSSVPAARVTYTPVPTYVPQPSAAPAPTVTDDPAYPVPAPAKRRPSKPTATPGIVSAQCR